MMQAVNAVITGNKRKATAILKEHGLKRKETGAGQPFPDGDDGSPHPLAERRDEIEQAILANLLRLNQTRAATA